MACGGDRSDEGRLRGRRRRAGPDRRRAGRRRSGAGSRTGRVLARRSSALRELADDRAAAVGQARRSPCLGAGPKVGLSPRALDPARTSMPAVARDAGATVWLTGLPAAGKTTLASACARALTDAACAVRTLDGDSLRAAECQTSGSTAPAEPRWPSGSRAWRVPWPPRAQSSSPRSSAPTRRTALRRGSCTTTARFRSLKSFSTRPSPSAGSATPSISTPRPTAATRGLTGIDDPYERPTNPDLTLPVQPVTESVDAVLSILATLGVRIFSARAARSGCPTDRR